MRINHNIAALNTYRQLTAGSMSASKSMEKLSSGLRINRAGDDAAGLAISEKMRGQIRGLEQATRNAQDGISMIQTAEGALNEVHAILQRMRELANQAVNGTNTDDDRQALNDEVQQLKEEIDRIGNTTEFNTQKLLDGSKGAKTTSADLTGGVAVNVSSTNVVSIVDGSETKNNQIVVSIDVGGGSTPVELTLNLVEGTYNDLVSFSQAFNSALDQAAADLKNRGGTDVTAEIAKYRLGFDVDTTSGEVTFHLKEQVGGGTAGTVVTIEAGSATTTLQNILGGSDISLTAGGAGSEVTANAAGVAKDASGAYAAANAMQWDQFKAKIEDGLNPTVRQNNELKMTIDGLSITGYVAEGDYTSAAALETAVKNAIIGIDTTDASYTTFIATPTGANFATLASDGDVTGGLIEAVNALTVSDLEAKGYKGALNDMKAAYFSDLLSKAGNNLQVSFNSENKLTISGPAEMEFDESSQVASLIGMTNVNADIKNSGITFQIGANSSQTMTISINDMRTSAIGETNTTNSGTIKLKDIDVSTKTGAQDAIEVLDTAIKQVSQERSKLGAYQNRLEHTINNLGTSAENLTAAESRIRDVDYALAA
jgi:flagellin